MTKFFCWNGPEYDLYINKSNIETIKDDGDSMLDIEFVSGIRRRIGPFDKDEIGHVIDELNS